MIPKIIHYCWIGGKEKPQSVEYCIRSWKKYCPDYEIIEWNENNYDFTKNEYMKQAYEAQKWGFVPDYARLDIVYEYGGLYFDTDVELISNLDELLNNKAFMGFEDTGDGEWFVNCGHGFGAEPHNEIIREARDLYDQLAFKNEDGSLNLLASPHFTTMTLRQFGLKQNNTDQELDGMKIYASDVLCPKNFRTGKITRSERTVSIHHYSATWVDEKIRNELKRQQRVNGILGKKIGRYYLIMESVVDKYSGKDMIGKLPGRVIKKTKQQAIKLKDDLPYYIQLVNSVFQHSSEYGILLLDTYLNSDNSGDAIIMENCEMQLGEFFDLDRVKHIPTHSFPDDAQKNLLKSTGLKILCGTNILSGRLKNYGLWKMDKNVALYKDTVLMAVGFDSKDASYDFYTKQLLHSILSKQYIHSVRDSFSEKKLKSMGIENVVNTGCVTMWDLTPEFCKTIPAQKGRRVLTTITDYHRDQSNDSAMLNILLDNYETVYLWKQGKDDYQYVCDLGYQDKVVFAESDLASLDSVLKTDSLDYVGTRLHAGIRAIKSGKRSLIVSIDNRAECIAEDTNLPVIKREDIPFMLNECINSELKTEIRMPWESIQKWKNQFSGSEEFN